MLDDDNDDDDEELTLGNIFLQLKVIKMTTSIGLKVKCWHFMENVIC